MKKATIMDIQRYSIHDGPGIRTTVFFKGCHMSCRWCHNPESQSSVPEMMYYADLCAACRTCDSFCPRGAVSWEGGRHLVDLKLCADCDRKAECAQGCPSEALRLCGVEMSVEDVLREILRDKAFYGGEGGVTCSGGEPLLQEEFLAELLEACRVRGIGTCVDTTLDVDWSAVEHILPVTDLFLVDLKFMDRENALRYTGQSNHRMLANLKRLSQLQKPVIVRVPVIPDVNDTPEEKDARQVFLSGLSSVLRVDRFPVTNHGAKKYAALQKENWLASHLKKAMKQNL